MSVMLDLCLFAGGMSLSTGIWAWSRDRDPRSALLGVAFAAMNVALVVLIRSSS